MSRSELFLVPFLVGLMLGVRLMFFGAERRRRRNTSPHTLRRSEPAVIAFMTSSGVAGYLLTRHALLGPPQGVLVAGLVGLAVAALVTWLAIAMTQARRDTSAEDPRYAHQGRIGEVSLEIPQGGEGAIRFEGAQRTVEILRARALDGGAIPAGEEICIERIENHVAHVERWSSVEHRL